MLGLQHYLTYHNGICWLTHVLVGWPECRACVKNTSSGAYVRVRHSWKLCLSLQVVTALMMERGDPILCEEFSYFYMLDSVITAAGYKVLPVAMDEHGMKPEHLNQVRLLILTTTHRQP